MAERKKNPLEHLKKPTRVAHPEKKRDQKLVERKAKGREVSKGKMKTK